MTKYINIKNIIITAVFLRLLMAIFLFDTNSENYWEYGETAKNIIGGRGYSLFYIAENDLQHKYDPNTSANPSAYMPPLYTFRLIPFMLINNIELRNILLLISNLILSAAVILMLYKLIRYYFSETAALAGSAIYAVLPEFIYAALGFSPVLEFHFLILYLIYCLNVKSKFQNLHIFISIFLLTAMRSESLAFAFIIIVILLKLKDYRKAGIVFFAAMMFVIPWSLRNYYVFEEFIPTSTNSGINLYRGHNSIGPGYWGDGQAREKIKLLPNEPKFELKMDSIYRQSAFEYIKNEPEQTIINSFKKVFHLWLYYPLDKRSVHPLYLLPWLLLLSFSIYGIIKLMI